MGSRVFWLSLLPFPTRTYTTAQSPAACILHPRTANAYTVGPSPAPGSVRCLQLLGRTWLAPIPESRDHPLHRPFLDKLISENGPAENPQEIILNSLPCKCLFLWDLSRHRFQPDCLLRPLNYIDPNAPNHWGIRALKGRWLIPSDAPPGQEPQRVVVVSYQFWQRYYMGDP